MKIETQKIFVLTQNEQHIIDVFLQQLNFHPLPCTNCEAYIRKKCKGYSIWDCAYDNYETCSEIIDWMEHMQPYTQQFINLTDEELKQLIEDKYLLEIAKARKIKSEAEYKLAISKYDTSTFSKIITDYSEKDKRGYEWGNKIEQEEFNEEENLNEV